MVHLFPWKGSSWTWGEAGICVGIWLVVGLGISPLLLHPQTSRISSLNITMCHDGLGKDEHVFLIYYFLSLVGLSFGLPFVLMTIFYSCILVRLLAKGRRYGQVVCVLALVFILCFTPSNVLLFIHYMLEATGCHNVTYIWYILVLLLGTFNNYFSPFVYFYVSQDFRGWVWDAGCCCPGGLKTLRGGPRKRQPCP